MPIMNPQNMDTKELVRLAKVQLEMGKLEDSILNELQARCARQDCPPPERAAIVELDRLVFIPHFGYTKLPPGILPLPAAKAARPVGPNELDRRADTTTTRSQTSDPRTVFVVHGRNEDARKAMLDFLRAIGLKPLEWSQAISATGEATPYIGHVLDTAFFIAQAVVVLMTPDDEAWLRKEFQTEHDADSEKKPTGQARPNVLFEAGMAFGRHPKRTVLVEIGTLRPFSDVGGRHVLRLNNSSERRQDLAERLQTAGCAVDLSGRDWHTVGSFEVAVTEERDAGDGREFLVLEQGVYWEYRNGQKTSDGPFCQVCFDKETKAIHLQNGDDYGGGFRWFCLGCHNGFGAGEGAGMFSSSD
jgi:predicted nucleotide-binding protein